MNFSLFFRLGLFALASLVFTGCATIPGSQPFNHEQHGDIEKIEVLAMRETEPSVHIANNPGYSFGLIGVLIAEGHMSSRRDWFKDKIDEHEIDHVAIFSEEFANAMAERGYQLVWTDGLVEANDEEIKRYSWGARKGYSAPMVEDADAIFDINFNFAGYAAVGSGTPYRPTVMLTAKLVDSDDHTDMFFEQIVYHDVGHRSDDAIIIQPDTHFSYDDFDALQEADDEVIEGFRIALARAAQTLAEQFPPRP